MSLARPAKHDDLLNYRLKRLFSVGGAPAVRLCEGRYGVSRNEWRLIAALVEHGPQSPSALHQRVGGDRARSSRVVSSLVEKGLAKRSRDSADNRRWILEASASGLSLYRELLPKLCRINERLVSVLDASEVARFEEYLGRLMEQALRIQAEGDGVAERADRRNGGSRRVWDKRGAPRAR